MVLPHTRGQPKEVEGFPVVTVPSFSLPLYPAFRCAFPWCSEQTRQRLSAFRADVLHALDPLTGLGWIAQDVARRQRSRLVTSYHTNLAAYLHFYHLGWLAPLSWSYVRWMHRHTTSILCPSLSTQHLLREHGIRNTHLWSCGVNAERFHPGKRSEGWRNALTAGCRTRCLLLFVGRLAAEKRIEDLFPLLDALPDCHLAIVGEGPERKRLEQQARGRSVTFLGHLNEDELAGAYASADIFVQPSTTETFGNATLEAMASGLPLVAAAAGGTLDLLRHQETAWLYHPDQPDACVRAVRHLHDETHLRVRLGKAARHAAEQRSWYTTTAALRQQYSAMADMRELEIHA